MRKLALIVLSLSLGACGNEPTSLAADAAGTYALTTVDGAPPPFVYVEAPGYRDVILGGIVTLAADGSFTDATHLRVTRDQLTEETSVILRGTWAARGRMIEFNPDPRIGRGRPYTMSFGGDQLTLIEAGVTSVFQRVVLDN
jgi:hypothetical protein